MLHVFIVFIGFLKFISISFQFLSDKVVNEM